MISAVRHAGGEATRATAARVRQFLDQACAEALDDGRRDVVIEMEIVNVAVGGSGAGAKDAVDAAGAPVQDLDGIGGAEAGYEEVADQGGAGGIIGGLILVMRPGLHRRLHPEQRDGEREIDEGDDAAGRAGGAKHRVGKAKGAGLGQEIKERQPVVGPELAGEGGVEGVNGGEAGQERGQAAAGVGQGRVGEEKGQAQGGGEEPGAEAAEFLEFLAEIGEAVQAAHGEVAAGQGAVKGPVVQGEIEEFGEGATGGKPGEDGGGGEEEAEEGKEYPGTGS
jgi:hypothetical protein